MVRRFVLWLAPLFLAPSLLGCGGSSSETPFPAPPLPDYLKPKASAAASPSGTGASTELAPPTSPVATAPQRAPATWAD